MSAVSLFPEVQDKSQLGALFSQPQFLTIAVEGQADNVGSAVVDKVYSIFRPVDCDTLFGPSSSLGSLCKFILGRGVQPILAVASAKGTGPTLNQRQTAWAALEANPLVRIRMTDDVAQATLAALAVSCENAALLFNKQIGFGGLASGSSKATIQSAAQGINDVRFVLVGPGVLDQNGVLLSGNYAAAMNAAEVAKNPDISDNLDLLPLFNTTGIEVDNTGQPLFNERVVGGVVVNDFQDLLGAGVSPLMTDRLTGTGARLTHNRTTYTGDSTRDSLMTQLIMDQIFLDIKNYAITNNYMRRGNTQKTRDDLAAGVSALLLTRNNWIQPITQSDGNVGYGVSVIPSSDLRSVTIQYSGKIVRDIIVIIVSGVFTIPV